MRALLILSAKHGSIKVVVSITEKSIKEQVVLLLERNKGREAFDLLKSKAEVEAFLPAGARLSVSPQVTLVEDLL